MRLLVNDMMGRSSSAQAASKLGASYTLMVGAFPPPVKGMPVINAAVKARLLAAGAHLQVINLASVNLNRSLLSRLGRLPVVIRGWWCMLQLPMVHHSVFYMSISGGWGRVYEALFLVLARFRHMRVVLHHHSFAYLYRADWLAACIIKLAGSDALHVTQSKGMATRMYRLYPAVHHVVAVSNAALLPKDTSTLVRRKTRRQPKVFGFLSNLCREKGVFEFLDVCDVAHRQGRDWYFVLAGPFQDMRTERAVRERLRELSCVEYRGPVYGAEKQRFYDEVDVFLFPTRYRNETEGIIGLNALSFGIPVIAFAQGAIPEYVDSTCGCIVQIGADFVFETMRTMDEWTKRPEHFAELRCNAVRRFDEIRDLGLKHWSAVQKILLSSGGNSMSPGS